MKKFLAKAIVAASAACGRPWLLDPPAWMYRCTFGEWADFTVKPLNPANVAWRVGQWAYANLP